MKRRMKRPVDDLTKSAMESPPVIAPPFSDEALALEFAEHHAATMRYVAQWGHWMIWDGKRWRKDNDLLAFDRSRAICRANAMRSKGNENGNKSIASAKTVAAVAKLVQADRRIVAVPEQWDADPWLLNTPGGIVDLKTGKLLLSRSDAYMTKMTAVAPGKGCERWLDHLKRVTNKDVELQAFLQRIFGYALTGLTVEHALFFFYGKGSNGKGVTIDTVAGILGDYQRASQVETFTEKRGEAHPTEVADLMGARLVAVNETDEGRRWAESRIKMLTGGGKVSARFMRQDFFQFEPQFKLVIAGNHKPGLRNVDEAMRRRFHLVPFTVTIPKVERNLKLSEELKTEWPGILQWMIDGCLEWQEIGLAPPASVTSATEKYLGDEDRVQQWFDDCCVKDASEWTRTQSLFDSWQRWATERKEYVISEKRLADKLEDMGFVRERGDHNRSGFRGLKLEEPF